MLNGLRGAMTRFFTPIARALLRLGVSPEINAVCTLLIAVVAAGVIGASLLQRRARIAA